MYLLNFVDFARRVLLIAFVCLATACNNEAETPAQESAASASTAQSPADAADSVKAEFDAYKERFLDEFWSFNPGWATYVGYYKYDDDLFVADAESLQAYRAFLERSLGQVGHYTELVEKGSLASSEATDLALMKNQLESSLWYLDEFKSHQWNPAEYNVASIFGLILGTDYKPLEERLQTISRRLMKVPAYYTAAQQNIDVPTREYTQLAIEQNTGALAVFAEMIPQKIKDSELPEADAKVLESRSQEAVAAIEAYIEFLKEKQSNFAQDGARSFRLGPEQYEQKFKYDIVSDLSAQQLYDKAVAEKESLHQRMFEITQDLWAEKFPDTEMPQDKLVAIRQMIDVLSVKHVERENFVAEVRRQIPELQAFVEEHDLLDTDPTRPLVVRETPAYQRGFAGASVDAPGPYDATANTYYNVSPLDDMSAEQAESWLREYNHWILQILNIHEAIPGHYTQLVHANKSPSVIKAVFGNGAMIEGWAVYSELAMMEAGYGDNAPEMWLMYSKWNLRAVINTILDYAIHVLDMQEQEALDMLVNEGFQQQAEAEGKWRRATVSQVQLTSYFNGYAEIVALRAELRERLGEKFDLKSFHNQFLSYGNAPVPVIRRLMLAQLDQEQATQ